MYSDGRCDPSGVSRATPRGSTAHGPVRSIAPCGAARACSRASPKYHHSDQEECERRVGFIVEIGFVENDSGLSEIARDREVGSISSSVGIIERALSQVDEYDYLVPPLPVSDE